MTIKTENFCWEIIAKEIVYNVTVIKYCKEMRLFCDCAYSYSYTVLAQIVKRMEFLDDDKGRKMDGK